jgi:hypothetical protein
MRRKCAMNLGRIPAPSNRCSTGSSGEKDIFHGDGPLQSSRRSMLLLIHNRADTHPFLCLLCHENEATDKSVPRSMSPPPLAASVTTGFCMSTQRCSSNELSIQTILTQPCNRPLKVSLSKRFPFKPTIYKAIHSSTRCLTCLPSNSILLRSIWVTRGQTHAQPEISLPRQRRMQQIPFLRTPCKTYRMPKLVLARVLNWFKLPRPKRKAGFS